MPEIKGDYQGKLKTIKATADAKLETVTAIDAGTNVIGNIDRVATVGHIDGLGTVEHVNRIESLGTVNNIPRAYDLDYLDHYCLVRQSLGLVTSPGINSGTFMPLAVNPGGKLKTAPATERKGGAQTVNNAGTAVALIGTHTACIGVIVKAQHENLGTIYLGDSGVTAGSAFLLRRDEFISFSADDVNDVYIDASRGTQKVSFMYINY